MSRARPLSPAIALMVALVLFVLPNTSGEAAARGPDLRLRPNDGVAGETVTARGKGFEPGATGTIAWGDLSRSFGEFTADADGALEVAVTVPALPPGDYTVSAITPGAVADDIFTIEPTEEAADVGAPAAATPASIANGMSAPVTPDFVPNACDDPGQREVAVANAAELAAAFADAQPGDRITLADDPYQGNFVATADSAEDDRIALFGAAIDGGGWEHSGYALHLQGDFWTVSGITVTNAQKGVMADGVTVVVLDGIEVHTIGHEAVHFRTHSTDNVIQRSDIHDTGLDNEKFGEGVCLGTAVSNWEK